MTVKVFRVRMLAFGGPGEVRDVTIDEPDPHASLECVLEQVFRMGQNDFQPRPHPSVSVGDVIEMSVNGHTVLFGVAPAGFRLMLQAECDDYALLPRATRSHVAHKWQYNLTGGAQ
jgi:hypothetical protein